MRIPLDNPGQLIEVELSLNSEYHLSTDYKGRWIQDGILDMNALLKAFQDFWREHSEIWVEKYEYREAAPHLILQAFLQRVVNGGGSIEREYSAGRGRIDLCVSVGFNRYPIELKIHRSSKTVDQGLEQTAKYMDRLGVDQGWLVVFNRSPDLAWDEKITWETQSENGKTIHVLGC